MSTLKNLSKEQIFVIKGIGIIMIVLHNYIHVLSGIGENEMNYNFQYVLNLKDSFFDGPFSFLNGIITYFGHFGVQLFVFASSYGLTKKYYKHIHINYKEYILTRLVKIYSLLIFGIILLFISKLLFEKEDICSIFTGALRSLSMTNNLSYKKLFSFVGPWWFFSLIIQLYIIFPFLFHQIRRNKKHFYFLLIASYLLIYILFPFTEAAEIPLFANFIGHLPEFLVGIFIALYPVKFDVKLFFTFLFIFAISNLSVIVFPLSFLSVTILLLFICLPIVRKSEKTKSMKMLIFTGKLSMFIFLINGPVRTITLYCFLDTDSYPISIFTGSIVHLIIVIAISFVLSIIYNKFIRPISNKFLNFLMSIGSKDEIKKINM